MRQNNCDPEFSVQHGLEPAAAQPGERRFLDARLLVSGQAGLLAAVAVNICPLERLEVKIVARTSTTRHCAAAGGHARKGGGAGPTEGSARLGPVS